MCEAVKSLRELFEFDEVVTDYLIERLQNEEELIRRRGLQHFSQVINSFTDEEIEQEDLMKIYNKYFKKGKKNVEKENEKVTFEDITFPLNIREYWKRKEAEIKEEDLLGAKEKQINYNSDMPLSESVKRKKEKEKDRLKQLSLFGEWKKNKTKIPVPVRMHNLLHYEDEDNGKNKKTRIEKMYDIKIENFNLSIGQRSLLNDTTLIINSLNKYGLIGKNGIGKSTLLGKLASYEVEEIKKGISIACIEQELFFEDVTVLECVLMVDKVRHDLLKEVERLEALRKNVDTSNQVAEKELSEKKKKSGNTSSGATNTNVPKTAEDIDMQISRIYEKLNSISYLETEKEASKILCGLGFDSNLQKKKVSCLSGGMRMRLCLSRILFSNNDIILLDEPTNHLDIYTIQFLIDYVNKLEKTCIIVSHDRDFLNAVCTDIIHFHNQKLVYYKGNYDQYEKCKIETLLQQQREYDAIEFKKKHVQKFIDKFRCNSKRAALVQSRIKLLNKLPIINLEKEETPFSFFFLEPFFTHHVLISVRNVSFKNEMFKNLKIKKRSNIIIEDGAVTFLKDDQEKEGAEVNQNGNVSAKHKGSEQKMKTSREGEREIGKTKRVNNDKEKEKKKGNYEDEDESGNEIGNKDKKKQKEMKDSTPNHEYQFFHEYLFKNANFDVTMESRIAICGLNGSGKTTLIKIILKLIDIYEGELIVNNKANIGYYSQYHVDNLNPVFNSIEQLQYNYAKDNIKEHEAIKYFNKFNIPTNLLYEPIYVLSGGQKSKLALAILAYKNPNILILDEPTNHLDIESVQALIVALNLYKGGLIIISHDTYLIKHVADEIYHINNFTREVIKVNWEFDEYTNMILENKI